MGKNKRKHPDVEEILARPWCYYCERDFDDLKILINHQKAKHFKCERCGRRLNTAGGLSVHMTQVHKETLNVIEHALPNRSGLDIEIFGMEGIPEEVVQSHQQRMLQSFAQAEAERRAATGNTGNDSNTGAVVKKPKFEAPSDLKKRLAEHKAKKAAEEAAGISSSGNNTPRGVADNTQSPGAFGGVGSPSYQQQLPFSGPPNSSTYTAYPPAYGQQGPPGPQPSPFQPPQQQMPFQHPPQQSPFQPPQQQPPFQHPPQQPPFQQHQQQPPFQQHSQQPPFQQQQPSPFQQQQQQPPPFQQQQQPGFGHPGMPQYPHDQSFAPPPQFQGQGGPGLQPQYPHGPPQFQGPPPQFQQGPPLPFHNGHNGPPQLQNSPPRPYSAGSPTSFQQNQFQPPRHNTPPQLGGMVPRPGSLPPAPGLPQRPAFGAPPVNAMEMQQMHQGQLKGPTQNGHQSGPHHGPPPGSQAPGPNPLLEPSTVLSGNASSLDDLVSGAAKDADNAASAAEINNAPSSKAAAPRSKATAPAEEKKSKKDKDKSKLVYSDNEISPEEKMAQMPRYAFVSVG